MNKNLFPGEEYNAPATEQEITNAFKALGNPATPDIAALYLSYDGVSRPVNRSPFRLMPLEEVVYCNETFQSGFEISEVLQKYHLRWFWTDDESNYLGMFMDGALQGMIAIFDHDGAYSGDESPLFRNLKSAQLQIVRLFEWERTLHEHDWTTGPVVQAHPEWFPYLSPDRSACFSYLPTDYPDSDLRTDADRNAWLWAAQLLERCDDFPERERAFVQQTFARLAPDSGLGTIHALLTEGQLENPGYFLHNLFLRGNPSSLEAIVKFIHTRNQEDWESNNAIDTLAKWVIAGKLGSENLPKLLEAYGCNVSKFQAACDSIIKHGKWRLHTW